MSDPDEDRDDARDLGITDVELERDLAARGDVDSDGDVDEDADENDDAHVDTDTDAAVGVGSDRAAGPRNPNDASAPPGRVVFGVRPVEELCRARPREVAVVYVAEGHKPGEIDRAIACARDRAIAVETRPRAFVAGMAGRTAIHQGIVALVGAYRYATVDAILAAAAAANEPPLIMLLDGVTDPHNLGAVIRSAEVLGGHGVIIPERNAAPVTGAVVKASAGATERVHVARVGHLLGVVDFLRKAGVTVLASGASGGQPLASASLTGPLAFVLGSEGRGARESVIRRCDGMIAIPQRGAIASLNVSVAGALLLYEAMRQRAR